MTLSRSASPIIGANSSPANSRGQHPVRIGKTNRILASLLSRSSRCWRCRIKASTALSRACDITWKPLVVSAISAIHNNIALLCVEKFNACVIGIAQNSRAITDFYSDCYLPGRHSANVSKMHNSTSSSCSFAIAIRAAFKQADAPSLLVALCPRIFIKSIGHVAARKAKRADHPRRRILFCSSVSRIEKSRCRRAPRTAARNICADTS